MRDFLPTDVRKRNYVIGIVKEVYESYGFEPLETPSVENIDTLMGKYGEEGNQLIFRVLKRGDKLDESLKALRETGIMPGKVLAERITPEGRFADLALRYDLTVPLARVVANNKNDLPKFFKRYQIQPVWRADRPARGRFREFYQCDVDCIGSESMVVEAEIISAVSEILSRLGFRFLIQINHRALLTGLLESANIPSNLLSESLIAIDKFDKIDDVAMVMQFTKLGLAENYSRIAKTVGKIRQIRQKIINEVGEKFEFSDPQERYFEFNESAFKEIGLALSNIASATASIEGLRNILKLTKCQDIVFNPFLARGLSYYTGTIMEITVLPVEGFEEFNVSIGGGGRYDGLIGMFGKEQIPACGFSLGLERILVVMEERGMFPPEIAESTAADVMVTIWSEETVTDSLKLANELRASGLRVTVYPEADKLGKQIKYADSIKVPWVCIIGDEEAKAGKVKLKNMTIGEESTLTVREIVLQIAESR